MGTYINTWIEVKKEGLWGKFEEPIFKTPYDNKPTSSPFEVQSYYLFAFLADVRNDLGIIPIDEPRGFPKDSEWLNEKTEDWFWGEGPKRSSDLLSSGYCFSPSWFTLKELMEYDYKDTKIPDPVEGKFHTLEDILPDIFFEDLLFMSEYFYEEVRIVFYFD